LKNNFIQIDNVKEELMDILEITKENFDEEVLQSEKPVLLDFWATWCGPCQMQTPILHTVAGKIGDTAVIGKVNVDEQMELARQFDVMSIPTIIVIKQGKMVFRASGVQTESQLMAALES
jgi:thioredoxin 1